VHLPGWGGEGPRNIEPRVCRVKGVISAQANPLTTNVLIHFDPAATDERAILGAMGAIGTDLPILWTQSRWLIALSV
jgi:hypothetical protein